MVTPFGTLFNKGAAPVLERALSFAEQRHKLIAHNIANLETPYFKPVDLDVSRFHEVLRRSMQARDARTVRTFRLRPRTGVWETGPARIGNRGGWASEIHFEQIRAKDQGAMRHGENRVDIDREAAKLAKNGILFRMYATLLKKHYTLLADTIAERP